MEMVRQSQISSYVLSELNVYYSYDDFDPPLIDWSFLAQIFVDTPADVVTVLDCCHAGSCLNTDRNLYRSSAIYKVWAACGFNSRTPLAAAYSFTFNLTKVLQDSYKSPSRLEDIHNQLCNRLRRIIPPDNEEVCTQPILEDYTSPEVLRSVFLKQLVPQSEYLHTPCDSVFSESKQKAVAEHSIQLSYEQKKEQEPQRELGAWIEGPSLGETAAKFCYSRPPVRSQYHHRNLTPPPRWTETSDILLESFPNPRNNLTYLLYPCLHLLRPRLFLLFVLNLLLLCFFLAYTYQFPFDYLGTACAPMTVGVTVLGITVLDVLAACAPMRVLMRTLLFRHFPAAWSASYDSMDDIIITRCGVSQNWGIGIRNIRHDLELYGYTHILENLLAGDPVVTRETSNIFQVVKASNTVVIAPGSGRVMEPNLTTVGLSLALSLQHYSQVIKESVEPFSKLDIQQLDQNMVGKLESATTGILTVESDEEIFSLSPAGHLIKYIHQSARQALDTPAILSILIDKTLGQDFIPSIRLLRSSVLMLKKIDIGVMTDNHLALFDEIQDVPCWALLEQAISYAHDASQPSFETHWPEIVTLLDELDRAMTLQLQRWSRNTIDGHWSRFIPPALSRQHEWEDDFKSLMVTRQIFPYVREKLPIVSITKSGQPLMAYACLLQRGGNGADPEIARLLLQHGADPNQTFYGESVWEQFLDIYHKWHASCTPPDTSDRAQSLRGMHSLRLKYGADPEIEQRKASEYERLLHGRGKARNK